MLSWMIYSVVLTLVFGMAAALWERAAIIGRWPARWSWAGAGLLSIAVPIVHALWPEANARQIVEIAAERMPDAAAWDSRLVTALSNTPSALGTTLSAEQWLGWAWLLASAIVAMYFGFEYLAIRREYAKSHPAVIAGHTVAITQNLGPAVIGWVHPTIVMPQWIDQLTAEQRDLVVTHEYQHLRARDIQLIGLGVLVLIVLPWNAALWWLFLRLRLAIELDCDARVLRTSKDAVQYGKVLLHASTLSSARAHAAPALFESTTHLEKRVRALVRGRAKYDRILVALLIAMSAAMGVATANVDSPRKSTWLANPGSSEVALPSPQRQFDEQWTSLVDVVKFFEPAALAPSPGMASYVFILVDRDGRVASHHAESRPSLQSNAVSEEYARSVLAASGAGSETYSMFLQVSLRNSLRNPDSVVLAVDPAAKPLNARAPKIDLAAIRRDSAWLHASLIRRAQIERSLLRSADANAIDAGLSADEEIWMVLDSNGRYLASGRRKIIVDPNASRTFIEGIDRAYRIADVVRGTSVKDRSGKRLQVSWHWLLAEQGANP